VTSLTIEPGALVGPYRLRRLLGEGAMGVVYEAVREDDGLVVALKILRAELSHDDVFRRRFVHEARAAQEVKHKHLVPILDAGEVDERSYLAVEYVPGRTLEQVLEAEAPLPLPRTTRIVAHVASALDALHRAEIVHRDVKPSNVLIAHDGSAALTDFGLAKGRAYTVLTRPGMVLGTLDYVAPELLKGAQATSASDIYSLGCAAYECVAGRAPFADRSMFDLAAAHMNDEPADPAEGRPEVPPEVSWAISQALAKDPAARPPTATSFANMLAFAAGTTGSSP
jgi:serine/threonine protein kinase